jgi:hypothetical protein
MQTSLDGVQSLDQVRLERRDTIRAPTSDVPQTAGKVIIKNSYYSGMRSLWDREKLIRIPN